jgi:Fic family protein
MRIEAARAIVAQIDLPPSAEAHLREQARLRSTHFSTYIEGNRLTLAETRQVVAGRKVHFYGRERDVTEVRNYWRGLTRIEEWVERNQPLTEELIRRLHALVEYGPRVKPTPYRDGQNAIRDARTGALVYLPPEACDVPELMTGFIRWYDQAVTAGLPVPLVAGRVHYQLVTIHPFYDGNGRTARLLATFLLHRGGYGLHGFFSLEEYHARDLDAYYHALAAHPDYNYFGGRAHADLTPWLAYFTALVARVFTLAQEEAQAIAHQGLPAEPEALRRLDRRARTLFVLFTRQETITTTDVAALLGLSNRSARDLLAGWVAQGWLEMTSAARRNRAYRLSAEYRQFIGRIKAE